MDSRTLKAGIPVTISLILLVHVLRDVNPHGVLQRLGGIGLAPIVAVLALQVAIIIIISLRWRLIIQHTGCELPLSEAMMVYVGVAPAEIVLPAKTADLIKANYLHVHQCLPFSKGVSTILLDNLFDLAALICILSLGVAVSGEVVPGQAVWVLAGVGTLVAGVAAASRFVDHPVFASFQALGPRLIATLFVLALSVWLLVVASVTLYFSMADIDVPPTAVMLYLPLTVVLAALPITVGGVGSMEWTMRLFYGRFGPVEAIITAAVVQRLVTTAFPIVVGLPNISRVIWSDATDPSGARALSGAFDEEEEE